MVDWSLARQVARFAVRADGRPDLGVDVPALARELEPKVAACTRLEPSAPLPEAELVTREEWAGVNLDALAKLLDPVALRLDERLGFAGPLAGALRVGAGATLAAETGLVMGYIAQRVLGQYEISLVQPEAPARLLLVAPNLVHAGRELRVDRTSFITWIVAHELTHAFQFQSVPWLRGYLGDLLRRYLETVDIRIERGTAGGLPTLPEPSKLVERFREGGLAALVQTREQRHLMAEMQAAMSVVEGYSEYVMDVLGAELLPDWRELREAMDRRRRSRSAPERIIERLLGLDLKIRQYELGRRFCEAVAERAGVAALNRVWDSKEALPNSSELSHPDDWIERTAPAATAV
jgi:coenzyme F420 biosynthesis associated uncharacterized protein